MNHDFNNGILDLILFILGFVVGQVGRYRGFILLAIGIIKILRNRLVLNALIKIYKFLTKFTKKRVKKLMHDLDINGAG